jgi:hypothetical protein
MVKWSMLIENIPNYAFANCFWKYETSFFQNAMQARNLSYTINEQTMNQSYPMQLECNKHYVWLQLAHLPPPPSGTAIHGSLGNPASSQFQLEKWRSSPQGRHYYAR